MAIITTEVDALVVLIEDPKFPSFLQQKINQILNDRHKARSGKELKRHPIDFMQEKGTFNAEALTAEFRRIRAKTSTLPSTVRQCIESIVKLAIYDLISNKPKQQKQECQEEKKPVTSSKRKTAKKAGRTTTKD
ncbi:MAG: hypothetical protein AB2L20_14990 [Mangrovibacterium sp.]